MLCMSRILKTVLNLILIKDTFRSRRVTDLTIANNRCKIASKYFAFDSGDDITWLVVKRFAREEMRDRVMV